MLMVRWVQDCMSIMLWLYIILGNQDSQTPVYALIPWYRRNVNSIVQDFPNPASQMIILNLQWRSPELKYLIIPDRSFWMK